MRTLYPDIAPHEAGYLDPVDGHAVHYEVCGNPSGEPILYLHGGPGSGCTPDARRFFDPDRFRIILFDQRGCGRSTPLGALANNTTDDLISDMERLRTRLAVDRWHLFGGSWGSTLALAYGQAHPGTVGSLTLYGVFLARERELRALYHRHGVAHQLFPDVFGDYLALLPETAREDPIAGYAALFASTDETTRRRALTMWTRLEKKLSRLIVPDDELATDLANPDYVLSHSLIENHYFRHHGFIDGQALLDRAPITFHSVPTHIIAGRYDLICPMITAWELHTAISGSTLTVVDDAGHSWKQPSMCDALITATDAVPPFS